MTKPNFTIQTQKKSAFSAAFIIEPLPQGYGHTLGNSLRRCLYSSIPGAAITSVSIDGVSHQFTTIAGVKEDVVEIILNLKQVRLSYTGDKPARITLSSKGAGVVTAADFETPADIKIANPDQIIATLSDKSTKLELTATVESGYGYSPADERKVSTIGLIPMDASFSPVTRVNYSVEATRVGRVTNFDKLILEISTDGTIDPQLALNTAAATLVEYFSAVSHPISPVLPAEPSSPTTPPKNDRPGSNISVEELDLPTRVANALQRAGLESVADLLEIPKDELAKVKNLGGKSVTIIEEAVKQRGFKLV